MNDKVQRDAVQRLYANNKAVAVKCAIKNKLKVSGKICFNVRALALKTNNFKWFNFARRVAWLENFAVEKEINDRLKEKLFVDQWTELFIPRWVCHHPPTPHNTELANIWPTLEVQKFSVFEPQSGDKFKKQIHSWLILFGLCSREPFLANFSANLFYGECPGAL